MTDNHSTQRPRCQKESLKTMRDPDLEVLPPRLAIRLLLGFTRHTSSRKKRWILNQLNRLHSKLGKKTSHEIKAAVPVNTAVDLEPDDVVRIRSLDEIERTLGFRRKLKGCTFMNAMKPYCGTTQKVFKPVKRMVDERDGKLKRVKGVVLLEGVTCQGIEQYGSCDRSCFYFWRKEWLEKI